MLCTMFKKQGAFFLYKELHESNSCGFERMSAMNTDVSHEYSDLSYEYWSSYLASFRVFTQFPGNPGEGLEWDQLFSTSRKSVLL